jgi:hypothetical protein
LVAETVNVDALPEETDDGLAEMVTVGAGADPDELGVIPEHPVNSNDRGRHDNIAAEQTRREGARRTGSHL